MRLAEYWTTENADPRHVYHDVLVALDAGLARRAGGRERPSAGPADQCGEVGRLPADRPGGRRTQHYPARFVGHIGIIPCVGGRDPAAEARLEEALAKSPLSAVRSLRRAPEEPDWSCWLSGDGWWLSVAPVPKSNVAGLRDV